MDRSHHFVFQRGQSLRRDGLNLSVLLLGIGFN